MNVKVFSTKVLIGKLFLRVQLEKGRDRHFTWSSEPREGSLAACRARGVLLFLSYFKTLNIGPVPGIEPATSRSAVNTLYRLETESFLFKLMDYCFLLSLVST